MGLFSRWWLRKKAEEVPIEPPAAHGCCEVCGDDSSMYIHSRCHGDVPTWAALSGDTLTIECAECGKVVTRFRIRQIVEER